jgi:hypothetical protein
MAGAEFTEFTSSVHISNKGIYICAVECGEPCVSENEDMDGTKRAQ